MDELLYSGICVVILIVICCVFYRRWVLVATVLVPIMSHVFHILFGEGHIHSAPIWDTYEVAVFLEVFFLRLYSSGRLLMLGACCAALISICGLLWSFLLPFGFGSPVWSLVALCIDVVLVLSTLCSCVNVCRRETHE